MFPNSNSNFGWAQNQQNSSTDVPQLQNQNNPVIDISSGIAITNSQYPMMNDVGTQPINETNVFNNSQLICLYIQIIARNEIITPEFTNFILNLFNAPKFSQVQVTRQILEQK